FLAVALLPLFLAGYVSIRGSWATLKQEATDQLRWFVENELDVDNSNV
ncbi:hypothetical protein LCGC14_2111120, partial [marine sediment metagenome]